MNFRQAWVDGEIEAGTLLDEIDRLNAELTASIDAPVADTFAARDVLAERRRQIEAEGWTPEHDDQHSSGEIAVAAMCYAAEATGHLTDSGLARLWPWPHVWWKPTTPRRDLVKAAALILAEIERLDRMTPNDQGKRTERSAAK